MTALSLADLQKKMVRILASEEVSLKEIQSLGILDQKPLDPGSRIEIYRKAFFLRTIECLEEDFPITLKVLGRKRFEVLCKDYLRKYRSNSWTLADLGRFLPEYCQTHRENPYLAELVSLEWLTVLSDHSPEEPVFSFSQLQGLQSSQIDAVRLGLSSSVQLFSGNWPVHLLGRRKKIQKRKTRLIIYYSSKQGTLVEPVSLKEYRVFSNLKRFPKMGELLSMFLGSSPTEVQEFFTSWASKGILTLNTSEKK